MKERSADLGVTECGLQCSAVQFSTAYILMMPLTLNAQLHHL